MFEACFVENRPFIAIENARLASRFFTSTCRSLYDQHQFSIFGGLVRGKEMPYVFVVKYGSF